MSFILHVYHGISGVPSQTEQTQKLMRIYEDHPSWVSGCNLDLLPSHKLGRDRKNMKTLFTKRDDPPVYHLINVYIAMENHYDILSMGNSIKLCQLLEGKLFLLRVSLQVILIRLAVHLVKTPSSALLGTKASKSMGVRVDCGAPKGGLLMSELQVGYWLLGSFLDVDF